MPAAAIHPQVETLSFVIYAPRYRSNSGGAIVMHKFCDVLNSLGYRSSLWPLWKPRNLSASLFDSPIRTVSYLASRVYRGPYPINAKYNTPVASENDVQDSVVIYPEIVNGNPLRAKRYVRWLLHEPGFHEGKVSYALGDLYFCYQEAFHKNCQGMIYGGPLTIADTLLNIYKQTNTGERTKICYMIRKGKDRPDLPDLRGKWVVDDLNHIELAKAFNECKICYFYDTYTAYAQYASACGCIPIIVPVPGITKTQWTPEEIGHLGVAYGADDIEYAIRTRHELLKVMQDVPRKNLEAAAHFVKVVREHFGA